MAERFLCKYKNEKEIAYQVCDFCWLVGTVVTGVDA
jgi:hypothetical protein